MYNCDKQPKTFKMLSKVCVRTDEVASKTGSFLKFISFDIMFCLSQNKTLKFKCVLKENNNLSKKTLAKKIDAILQDVHSALFTCEPKK